MRVSLSMVSEENRRDQFVNLFLSLLWVSLCYGFCIRFGAMMYLTNDDSSIQNYLSGVMTGTPYPVHQYISIFLSYPVSWLYQLFPNVQWWFVCDHAFMLMSMVIIHYIILATAQKRDVSRFMALALLSVVDIVFFFYPVSNASYTMTAGICGSCAVLLLLFSEDNPIRRTPIVISALFYFLSLFLRSQSGYVVFCYILLSGGIILLSGSRLNVKRIGVIAIGSLLLIGFSIGLVSVNREYQKELNGEEFSRFNSARVAYKDYPHDSYAENPELYEAVGWDENLYYLVDRLWCFMDERVNAESFRYLADHSLKERQSANTAVIGERLQSLLKSKLAEAFIWVWLSFAMCSIITSAACKEYRILIAGVANVLGTLLINLVQLYNGRILERTLIISLLPSTIISLWMLIQFTGKLKKGWRQWLISGMLLCIGIYPAYCAVISTFDAARKEEATYLAARDERVYQYALNHPENIYIKQTGITNSTSPYTVFSDHKPYNVIGWGGSTFLSAGNREKLKANGIEKLDGELLRHENVFIISEDDVDPVSGEEAYYSPICVFKRWVQSKYENVEMKKTDKIEDWVFVYHFIFPSEAE